MFEKSANRLEEEAAVAEDDAYSANMKTIVDKVTKADAARFGKDSNVNSNVIPQDLLSNEKALDSQALQIPRQCAKTLANSYPHDGRTKAPVILKGVTWKINGEGKDKRGEPFPHTALNWPLPQRLRKSQLDTRRPAAAAVPNLNRESSWTETSNRDSTPNPFKTKVFPQSEDSTANPPETNVLPQPIQNPVMGTKGQVLNLPGPNVSNNTFRVPDVEDDSEGSSDDSHSGHPRTLKVDEERKPRSPLRSEQPEQKSRRSTTQHRLWDEGAFSGAKKTKLTITTDAMPHRPDRGGDASLEGSKTRIEKFLTRRGTRPAEVETDSE